MKKKKWNRFFAVVLLAVMVASLLSGCGKKSREQENKETIRVYLWTTNLYEKYAPYIQSQLPDVLQNSLMDLSTTNEAGAVYNSYLNSFMNEDGSVNWLPVCADAHGFVVNKALFEKYNIPLPTDYKSFVSACQAFEKVGIRGFAADYFYDYTCMETLQGLSASELSSTDGRKWRTAYSDPASTEKVGLDNVVWPAAFDRMEQFIKDTKLEPDDINLNQGIDTVFLPFFEQNGEKWIMTTPYFQVALNSELEKDETRRDNAMKVLKIMLSAKAQNIIADGQDTLSYSQDVPLQLTDYLKDVKSVIEENHMYIRIASNDFFSVSQDVVSKMITGEYNSQQAYKAFDSMLRQSKDTSNEKVVLNSPKSYSNYFYSDGGNESYSVMANTLRGYYKSDVLLATGNSFTGSVLQADYTEKMAGNMIMPNGLCAYKKKMSGAELLETVQSFVEGTKGGFQPFNKGSLPVVSGISIEVKEKNGKYTLLKIKKDGKQLKEEDTFTVTCLATENNMTPFLTDEDHGFTKEEQQVKDTWMDYVLQGNAVLAEPEQYITLRE